MRNLFETRSRKALKSIRKIDNEDHKRGFTLRNVPDFTQGTVEHVIVVLEKTDEGKEIITPTRIRHIHAIDSGNRMSRLIAAEIFHI